MKRKGILLVLLAVVIACAAVLIPRYLRQQERVDAVWSRLKEGRVSVENSPDYTQCKNSPRLKKKILSFVKDTADAKTLAQLGNTLSQVDYDNAAVKTALSEKLHKLLQQQPATREYLSILALVSQAEDGYFDLEKILPQQELTAYLQENFTEAVIQKGAGGHYDGLINTTKQYTNELLYEITESHAYWGDFHLDTYDSKAYRPTGERWEDEQMKAYDEFTQKLYYRDQLLNCPREFTENFANYAYGAEVAYVQEDCVAVLRNGKFFTTQGNILYNREVAPYEEVAIHAAAICIPEAAYDDAGEAAMWFFTDNRELLPKLDGQQVSQLMPGSWMFYYMHAGALPVDFHSKGTLTEHYKSSDPQYPWGVEGDLLCQRKAKDGSWSIQYEVRQITEELYLLYTPSGRLVIAIQKMAE